MECWLRGAGCAVHGRCRRETRCYADLTLWPRRIRDRPTTRRPPPTVPPVGSVEAGCGPRFPTWSWATRPLRSVAAARTRRLARLSSAALAVLNQAEWTTTPATPAATLQAASHTHARRPDPARRRAGLASSSRKEKHRRPAPNSPKTHHAGRPDRRSVENVSGSDLCRRTLVLLVQRPYPKRLARRCVRTADRLRPGRVRMERVTPELALDRLEVRDL